MRAIENLINDLTHPDIQSSNNAKRTLVSMGSTVIEYLTQSLATVSDQHRWKIIQTLSEIGDSHAAPALVAYLDAESPAIRAAVAQFLGTFGDKEAVEPLLHKLVDHASAGSLIWVIQALGNLKDIRAVEPLIEVMNQTDSSPVRYTAIEALAQVGDYRAVEAIEKYADDPDRHVQAHVQKALQIFTQQHQAVR